jgi:hypothetical protein
MVFFFLSSFLFLFRKKWGCEVVCCPLNDRRRTSSSSASLDLRLAAQNAGRITRGTEETLRAWMAILRCLLSLKSWSSHVVFSVTERIGSFLSSDSIFRFHHLFSIGVFKCCLFLSLSVFYSSVFSLRRNGAEVL